MTIDWMGGWPSFLEGWQQALQVADGWLSGLDRAQAANLTAATRHLELMTRTYARWWGRWPASGGQPEPPDNRFMGDAWQENLAFDALKQIYLTTAQWMVDMADGLEEISPTLHKRARFWTQQAADALSPSNYPWTNPVVMEEMLRTGGTSLVRGMENLVKDLQRGQISMVPEGSFEVGRDLAITPGQVVYRNPLIELIQYAPATDQVRAVPVLAIPPWINKYYVMDLRPENSMYKHLVDAGFTLFTISWKNPDASTLDLEWADYMEQGVIEALRVVQAITGAPKVNTIGYCLGGIIQEVTLAYLTATGDNSVNAATYFATHQDFTDVGDVDVFLSEPEVRVLEWMMKANGGSLDGRNMAATFNMLRANDLLWHYVVHNYLLGQQPPAFDILYWNGDGTRIPGKVHSFLLREFFLANKLKEPGGIVIRGVGIDTHRVQVPTYAVAGSTDHIVPWRGAFKIREMLGGPVRFILAESGHIAGIINPPAKKRRAYWTSDEPLDDPDQWLAGATRHAGSWWVDWVPWLRRRSGKLVAPPSMGNEQYPPLMGAPGTYVMER